MFRCESTSCKLKNHIVPPRQPINTIVVEKRHKVYENKIRKGKEKGKFKRTEGWEIMKEIRVCPGCFRELTGLIPLAAKPKPEKTRFESRPRFKDRPPRKKWQNPRRKKKGMQAKDSKAPEKKKPVVQVVNKVPRKNDTRQ